VVQIDKAIALDANSIVFKFQKCSKSY